MFWVDFYNDPIVCQNKKFYHCLKVKETSYSATTSYIEVDTMFVSSSHVTCTLPTSGSYEITISSNISTYVVSDPKVTINYNPACFNCSTNPVGCELKVKFLNLYGLGLDNDRLFSLSICEGVDEIQLFWVLNDVFCWKGWKCYYLYFQCFSCH